MASPTIELCRLFAVALALAVLGCEAAREDVEKTNNRLRSLVLENAVEIGPHERALSGVTTRDMQRACLGVNIFTPHSRDSASLLDMNGNRVHVLTDRRKQCRGGWTFVKPYVDERFLVLAEGTCSPLLLINWQSNILWESELNFHNDVSYDTDGNIYVVSRRLVRAPAISPNEPILDEQLVVLSPDGQVKQTLSFADLFAQSPDLLTVIQSSDRKSYHHLRGEFGPLVWDVFHANTVEVLPTPGHTSPLSKFRGGRVLFCLRHLDLIGVIDLEAEQIVWHWGSGELDNPSGPTLLENGHILVLDCGTRRGWSRAVQMDPESGRIVGTIGDDPRTAFFTACGGGLQRLPNGNTLIMESQRGRVFEVATDGSVVWEFYSVPFQEERWKRPALYRLQRIVDYTNFPKLQQHVSMGRGPKKAALLTTLPPQVTATLVGLPD